MTEPNHESQTTSGAEPLTEFDIKEEMELWADDESGGKTLDAIVSEAAAEIRTLRKEKVEFIRGVVGLQVTIDTVEAEKANLRDALEQIRLYQHHDTCTFSLLEDADLSRCDCHVSIAKAALKGADDHGE